MKLHLTRTMPLTLLLSLCALPVHADDFIETFEDSALNMYTWQVYPNGGWKLTDPATITGTPSEKVPYAHMTLADRVRVDSLSVRLRPTFSDTPGSGVKIGLYEDGGPQHLFFSIEKTIVKITRNEQGKKPVIIAKPMTVEEDWQSLRVEVQGDESKFYLGDTLIGTLPTEKLADRSMFRLLTYAAEAEIDRVQIKGDLQHKHLPRIGKPISEVNYSDPSNHRVYTDTAVKILAASQEVDLSKASKLPAVSSWQVGTPDYLWTEFPDQTKFIGQQAVDFLVGEHDESHLPMRIRYFEQKNTPDEVVLHFNLANQGDYTFKLYVAGAKNLGNKVSVTVDGKMVYRDIMRGPNPKAIHSWFREHIPMHLSAGPHVIRIKTEFVQARFTSYMMSVYFDSLALEPGVRPLVFSIDATKKRPLGERTGSIAGSRTLSRSFAYEFFNLPKSPLQVELAFFEAVTDDKGFRKFDVSANGKLLLDDYDIVADGGPGKIIKKTFDVTPTDDGKLNLQFQASVGRAQINQIRILRGDMQVIQVNGGASPDRAYGFWTAANLLPRDAAAPPPSNVFDGAVNVVANPGFEHDLDDPTWVPIPEGMPTLTRSGIDGSGEMSLDNSVAKTGKRSLKISSVKGKWGVRGNAFMIDWTKPLQLTAAVKAQNATGKTHLALRWLIPDAMTAHGYDAHGSGIARGGVVMGPTITSEPITGTFDWKTVALDVQPPRGAAGAFVQIISEDNSGSVWFDDLYLDGYSSLPVQVISTVGGYQLGGHCSAVVLSESQIEDGQFTLMQDGKPTLQGNLISKGYCDWLESHAYLADFSANKVEGRFHVQVTGRNISATNSEPFHVGKASYLDLARHMAFYFYAMRCGEETLGYHQACHTDDAIVQSPYYDRASRVEPSRDLTGGWHDAGDFGKFNIRIWGPIYSLAALAEQVDPKWNQYGGEMPDIVSEVRHGADYTMKIHEGNGTFISKINGGFRGGHPAMPPSLETDQDPTTVDGFGRTAAWVANATSEPAHALAISSRVIKPYDAKRAAEYLEVAKLTYERTTEYFRENRGDHPLDWRDLFFEPKAMLAEIELYRTTGDEAYITAAVQTMARFLPLVERNEFVKAPYCDSIRFSKGSLNTFHYDFLTAPLELIRTKPNHPQAEHIKTVVRNAIEQTILPTMQDDRTPFGQITNLVDETRWHYPGIYMTELYPATAYLLAIAGNTLNEPSWLTYADQNLQWLIGRNARNTSYVSGIADRQCSPWSGLIHVPGMQHGTVPGAIAKGIMFGQGDVTYSGRPLFGVKGFGNPYGYMWTYVDSGDGFQPHSPATEIWEWFNYTTIMAAIELHKAYAPNEKGDSLPPMPLGSTNIIDNAGFERVANDSWMKTDRPKWVVVGEGRPDNWDFNTDQAGTVEIINDPKQVRFGERCLKINKSDTYRSASIVNRKPFFPIKKGQVYWVSVWVRGKGSLKLWSHECAGPTAAKYRYSRDLGDVKLSEEWNRIDVPYVVTGQDPQKRDVTHTRFGFALLPDTELYIDNFEVRLMAPSRAPKPKATTAVK